MGWIFDLIILAIFFFSLWRGWKKGAIKTLIGFLGTVAAVIAGFVLGFILSDTVFHLLFEGKLVNSVEGVLSENVGVPLTQNIDNIVASLPKWIANVLTGNGALQQKLGEITLTDVQSTAQNIVDVLIRPITVSIIRIFLTAILIIVFIFLVKIIAKTGSKVASLPILSQINSLAGAIFGGIKAAFLILLVLAVIRGYRQIEKEPKLFTEEAISSSFIFEKIYQNNPLLKIFSVD